MEPNLKPESAWNSNMIALKIHRKKYLRTALQEVEVHEAISRADTSSRHLLPLVESFVFEGHACLAFARHGRALDHWVDRKKFSYREARETARQLLEALHTLHASGFTHTDIKLDNILYDPKTHSACLADLGNARRETRHGSLLGSREYVAPEVLLGAPLDSSLDLWSLGCCVMETLTGRVLFDPGKAAAKKYKEFDRNGDSPERPAVLEDLKLEKKEQYSRGAVIAKKYRLRKELGCGRFSTVWAAEQISDELPDSIPRPSTHDVGEEPPEPSGQRAWRKKKGADDLPDLVLNYEHALLMSRLCGPFPPELLEAALYRANYFEADGSLRFRPEIKPRPIRDHLRRRAGLRGKALDQASDFLSQLLQLNPLKRPSAAAALGHPWLQ